MENIAPRGNFCTTKAGLTAISGQATTTYTTGALTLQYAVGGKSYAKTTITTASAPVLDGVTGLAFPALAANQGRVWVFGVDKDGTVSLSQGSIEALDTAGNFWRAPQFPILPDTSTAFGYVVAKNGSTGSAFTVGTSNWSQTGMTVAVVDVLTMPQRPQMS